MSQTDYSILTSLLQDPEISDIKCVSHNDILVKTWEKKKAKSDISFATKADYTQFLDRILEQNHISERTDQNYGLIRFIDEYSEQYALKVVYSNPEFNAFMEPLLHIRKLRKPQNET